MRSFKDLITKNLKSFFVLLGVFTLIVLFQNCGKNDFQTKSLGKTELASENTNNLSELPNDALPDSADDDQMREITDIFNDPRNDNNSNNSLENPSTNILTTNGTGKTYYVSTSGNNSNPGTSSKPFKTIAYAVSKMVAGDTTYVKSGVYSDHVWFGRSGTASAPIKLLNAPGESPVIDCGNGGTNTVLIQNSSSILKPMGYITIEGFEIRKCYYGIKMHNGANITIRRNNIHDNLKQGILGNGKNTVIDRNIISRNGDFALCARSPRSCNLMHGIYGTGPNWVVTNNLISGNLSYGIVVAGYKSCPKEANCSYAGKPLINRYTDATYAGANNWLIANNTIAYNNYRPGISVWQPLATKSKIINNIFYENSQKAVGMQGISFSSSGGDHEIKNNLCYATAPGATVCIGNGADKFTQSGNIINTLNPKFVNAPATMPSAPNFMLTSTSPAINKGLTTSATKVDFRSVARPRGSAYDIGAYEF